MIRTLSARLRLEVADDARLVFAVAAAARPVDERIELRSGGAPVELRELSDASGTRLHVAHVPAGEAVLEYDARVVETAAPARVDEVELIEYLRPSRYAESDLLAPTALAEFGGLEGAALLTGVAGWVGDHLSYVPGSSRPTDGAEQTLLARQGVCRDYAHLVVALLRALDVPARLVAAYAPGLRPMDFHAVAEAFVDGAWHVVDATGLAPRQALVRIATGRDAADTAFLTSNGGDVALTEIAVTAEADLLPADDGAGLVQLR